MHCDMVTLIKILEIVYMAFLDFQISQIGKNSDRTVGSHLYTPPSPKEDDLHVKNYYIITNKKG